MDDADLSHKGRTNTPVQEKPFSAQDSNVSYEDLMARIRHIVLTNRLRVGYILSLLGFLGLFSLNLFQSFRQDGKLLTLDMGMHHIKLFLHA